MARLAGKHMGIPPRVSTHRPDYAHPGDSQRAGRRDWRQPFAGDASSVFDRLVPLLILFATVLFTIQGPVQKRLKTVQGKSERTGKWLLGAFCFQLAVGIYGGYFGAGMSIMMLSALAILGMTDILQMNALTSFFSLCINGIAAALFIWAHMVYWPYVLAMAAAAILGGYMAAGVARQVGRTTVRRFVICVGFTIAAVLFVRML